jgi:DNA-binding MarR family transcriptional regulator
MTERQTADRQMAPRDLRIAAARRFNRFYTRQIGVLRKNFLDSPYSLGEARVIYEIASDASPTASEVGRALDLDAGYLSRVLRNFEKRGLIERKTSASDARQSHLALSALGRKTFTPLDQAGFFETAQQAAEITGIEVECPADIACRRQPPTSDLVNHARFAERIGAVEEVLPQHSDLARVEAVEASHRGDAALMLCNCRHAGNFGQIVD